MTGNIYIMLVMNQFSKKPEPVAICTTEEEYEDYKRTRDMTNVKVMAINTDHPKCPDIQDMVYDNKHVIASYFDDAPITLYEEEMAIDAECEMHCHIKDMTSKLRRTIDMGYLKFDKHEIQYIDKMLQILKSHADFCSDEDACVDLMEEMNYKQLLKHSKMLSVPFKD